MIRTCFGLALLTIGTLVLAADAEITLKPIKLKQFQEAVAAHKGKVIVVDFWANYCIPCKKEFHNIVRLHNTLTKDGLVAMSVSIDMNTDDEKAKALKFLTGQKATFANFIADESKDGEFGEFFKFNGVPAVAVYGRDGKLVKVFTGDDPCNQFTYADVEKLVKQLLASK